MKQSAGTLLYRQGSSGWEVLLVHPSGNYNRQAPWSIPKGLPDPDESLEQAARRETREETGIEAGALEPLGMVVYRKNGKHVHAFAGPAPADEPRHGQLGSRSGRVRIARDRARSCIPTKSNYSSVWRSDSAEHAPEPPAAEEVVRHLIQILMLDYGPFPPGVLRQKSLLCPCRSLR